MRPARWESPCGVRRRGPAGDARADGVGQARAAHAGLPASGVWTWTYVDYGINWSAILDNWSYNFNDAERGSVDGHLRRQVR